MVGWYGRSSRLVFSAFRRCSSKNGVIRSPISEFYQPIGFKSVQFCNNGLAKRFYTVGRNQNSHKQRWFQNTQNLRRLVVLGVCVTTGAVMVVTSLGLVTVVPITNRIHYVIVPFEHEKQIGKSEIKNRISKYRWKLLPCNHPQSLRVQVIAHNLIQALEIENPAILIQKGGAKSRIYRSSKWHFEWEVFVVDNPRARAFCIPGGKLVVFTGLLRYFRSDAEIASILAHQVAHAASRHWAERYTRLCSLINIKIGLSFVTTPRILDEIIDLLDFPLAMRTWLLFYERIIFFENCPLFCQVGSLDCVVGSEHDRKYFQAIFASLIFE